MKAVAAALVGLSLTTVGVYAGERATSEAARRAQGAYTTIAGRQLSEDNTVTIGGNQVRCDSLDGDQIVQKDTWVNMTYDCWAEYFATNERTAEKEIFQLANGAYGKRITYAPTSFWELVNSGDYDLLRGAMKYLDAEKMSALGTEYDGDKDICKVLTEHDEHWPHIKSLPIDCALETPFWSSIVRKNKEHAADYLKLVDQTLMARVNVAELNKAPIPATAWAELSTGLNADDGQEHACNELDAKTATSLKNFIPGVTIECIRLLIGRLPPDAINRISPEVRKQLKTEDVETIPATHWRRLSREVIQDFLGSCENLTEDIAKQLDKKMYPVVSHCPAMRDAFPKIKFGHASGDVAADLSEDQVKDVLKTSAKLTDAEISKFGAHSSGKNCAYISADNVKAMGDRFARHVSPDCFANLSTDAAVAVIAHSKSEDAIKLPWDKVSGSVIAAVPVDFFKQIVGLLDASQCASITADQRTAVDADATAKAAFEAKCAPAADAQTADSGSKSQCAVNTFVAIVAGILGVTLVSA